MIDILLPPCSKNKRLSYKNSTSGFYFDLSVVIGIRHTSLPQFTKFRTNRSICRGVMMTSIFQDGESQPY